MYIIIIYISYNHIHIVQMGSLGDFILDPMILVRVSSQSESSNSIAKIILHITLQLIGFTVELMVYSSSHNHGSGKRVPPRPEFPFIEGNCPLP